jgi:putative Mg2+ transporter-C (MgtC) family protein
MDILWQELTSGLPDTRQLVQVSIRLIAATLLGAVVGIERERAHKPAGLRTHILVSLGTTVFVLSGAGVGMASDAISRIIQGIATGIGFLGAGTILKLSEERDIQGLTTAAGIWMTSAIGVAVGLGSLALALLSAVLAVLILVLMRPLEDRIDKSQQGKTADAGQHAQVPINRDRGAT